MPLEFFFAEAPQEGLLFYALNVLQHEAPKFIVQVVNTTPHTAAILAWSLVTALLKQGSAETVLKSNKSCNPVECGQLV
ncbi:MAG: hypothetical protein DMG97_31380 [Acidobacteria bacterium]|nr:MAG: hypothetical protein DMG98_19150 [Acidobacteriota bacterium]PYV65753.1 MAG: hypothetical protein DMG97_31380 [Acidobacteriota bacterium]